MPSEQRFSREGASPRLAEVPDAAVELELEPSELLGRLERQAAESGRLEGRVQTLEKALRAEREARRRLAATIKRERGAAEVLYTRAEAAEAAARSQAEEVQRLREASGVAEQQLQVLWMQLSEAEREVAFARRPLWRKLLRRPPAS